MKETDNTNQHILAADIGGSHITAAVCTSDTHVIIPGSITRVDVQSQGSAADILGAWEHALKQATKHSPTIIAGVGVAVPGPFDYEQGISYITGLNKYESIYGLDIRSHFADALQLDAVRIKFRNDAEATIAGEALAGAGKGFDKVVGVTLGTGFGSAVCEQGITRDLNFGSDPYKDTIADDHLSTRWFLKRYNELSGGNIKNVKELAGLIDTDPFARHIFEEFGINMAEFLSRPLAALSPDVLVLCGNIAKASAYFLPHLQAGLGALPVKISELGETAALIGAAALFEPAKVLGPIN
jgi:glucokinase